MPASPLLLFVYGTLKRGHGNHERYCAGVGECHPASIRGRLHDFRASYPMLEIPAEDVLLAGGADLEGDCARAAAFTGVRVSGPAQVRGELLIFPGHEPLARLDQLEAFFPEQPALCEYLRLLAPVRLEDGRELAAWVYAIGPAADRRDLVHLPGGVWPPAAL